VVRGLEVELQARLPWKLGLAATAHLIESEVDGGTASLDGVPPPTLTLKLRRDFTRAWAWVRLGAYAELDDPGPTEQARPGYQLVDAAVGARFGSRLELSLVGRNLLDEAYLVSPDSRAVLAAGVSAILTLGVRF
jgi:outer membrane receptor protein involved in Fe transport